MMRLVRTLGLVTLSLAILLACAQSPEDTAALKKRFLQIDDLAERVKILEEKIDTLSSDVKAAYEDLAELKGQAPGLTSEDKAKISKLEKELNRLAKSVNELKQIKPLAKAPSERIAEPPIAPAKTPEARVVRPDTYAIPKGFYYTIKSGDTLEAIAKKYNLTTEQLLRANNMPPGATLYAGQKLFIPAKAK